MNKIYLDYAAATPLDEDVRAIMRAADDSFYNPSALYGAAVKTNGVLETARRHIAKMLGVKSTEVIFTAGGTEANNLALLGVANTQSEGHIVVSALEHESVLGPAEYLQSQGYGVSKVQPAPDGLIDPAQIVQAITDNTVLVSVMYANNEIGTVQPIREIAKGLQAIRDTRRKTGNKRPLYFHTDACQASNYLDLQVSRLGVDMMTLNASKIYGPKQVAVLVAGSHVDLVPLIYGGGQERGLRSGTENITNPLGFAAALTKTIDYRKEEAGRLSKIQQETMKKLEQLPGVTINGHQKRRLPNNIHITIAGADNERLLYLLDEKGFMIATGSACSASSETSSHVLLAIGLDDAAARSSLRITMGRQTTQANMDSFVLALKTLVS